MKWDTFQKRFKIVIGNNNTNTEDVVAMDSVLAEANAILSGELAIAA